MAASNDTAVVRQGGNMAIRDDMTRNPFARLSVISLSPEDLESLVERAVERAMSRHSAANEPMLTTKQAAIRLNVSEKTVSRRMKDGSLASLKVGTATRIPVEALRPPTESEVSVLALRARNG
jgi:excisionase family DNA binding protein